MFASAAQRQGLTRGGCRRGALWPISAVPPRARSRQERTLRFSNKSPFRTMQRSDSFCTNLGGDQPQSPKRTCRASAATACLGRPGGGLPEYAVYRDVPQEFHVPDVLECRILPIGEAHQHPLQPQDDPLLGFPPPEPVGGSQDQGKEQELGPALVWVGFQHPLIGVELMRGKGFVLEATLATVIPTYQGVEIRGAASRRDNSRSRWPDPTGQRSPRSTIPFADPRLRAAPGPHRRDQTRRNTSSKYSSTSISFLITIGVVRRECPSGLLHPFAPLWRHRRMRTESTRNRPGHQPLPALALTRQTVLVCRHRQDRRHSAAPTTPRRKRSCQAGAA